MNKPPRKTRTTTQAKNADQARVRAKAQVTKSGQGKKGRPKG